MDRETIIKLARESGLHIATDVNWMPIIGLEYLEHLANLVAKHEREACLALRQQLHPRNYGGQQTYGVQDLLGHMNRGLDDYADMIRARGNT